jgi:putative NADPH-quinone reductase
VGAERRHPSALVIHVHPLRASYTEALLRAVVDTLDGMGVAHEVVRLGGGGDIGPGALTDVEHLIVVAPTWWGAMPSRLLWWIQDELGPWIDGGRRRTSSPLRGVRALTVVTSHGSSRLVNALQGEPGRHLWRRAVLPLCAPGAAFDWVALYKIDRLDAAARRAFIDTVRDRVGERLVALASTGG